MKRRPNLNQRIRAVTWACGLFVTIALLGSCFGVSKNTKYWRTIGEYQAAVPLTLEQVPKSSANCRQWQLQYKLATGSSVMIHGSSCGPGSTATVKYSDEAESRYVYEYFDYVYPSDMRLEGPVLYTLVRGSTIIGIFGTEYTQLIVFDLTARKIVLKQKIDPKDLPERAP